MRFTFAALILLLPACAASPQRTPSSKDLPWGISLNDVPNPGALLRWSNPRYEESNVPSLDDLEQVEVPTSCPDQKLYPTHPQQLSKSYHVYRIGIYENDKLPADSAACKISSSGEKKFCLLADTYEYAVISDIFQDACGGLYRGVWSVGYLKRDDNMGTLLSKGRTVYPKPNATYQGEMEDGQTYGAERKDFLFLAPAFAGDKEVATRLAAEAQATHIYDSITHLFLKKDTRKAERRRAPAPIALEPKLAE